MAEHNDLGKWGEEMAVAFLTKRGYFVKERDWHWKHRDIDIIALTPDMRTIVFIEVKTRTTDILAAPEAAVTRDKIKSIGYVANAYLKMNRINNEMRFDLITIVGNKDEGVPKVEHWENAFNPMLAY